MIDASPRYNEFFWETMEKGVRTPRLRSPHHPNSRLLENMLAGAGKDFISVVKAMLRWVPEDRATMEELKGEPFFKGV